MSPAVWSLVTSLLSIAGLWIQGYSPRVGWWYGMSIQVVWAAYGVTTHQPGFILTSVVFVVLYARNLRRNRGRAFRTADAPVSPPPAGCGCDTGREVSAR